MPAGGSEGRGLLQHVRSKNIQATTRSFDLLLVGIFVVYLFVCFRVGGFCCCFCCFVFNRLGMHLKQHTHTHTYTHARTRARARTHARTHIHTHKHTHTHTHTHNQQRAQRRYQGHNLYSQELSNKNGHRQTLDVASIMHVGSLPLRSRSGVKQIKNKQTTVSLFLATESTAH